jgi:hypothetical protein
MTEAAAEGACIVCGHQTPDKTHRGGFRCARSYWHWRCADGEECSVRRNAGKRRPRPEAEVRAEWRARHAA